MTSHDSITSAITVSIPEFVEKYVELSKTTITFYQMKIINHYSKTEWTLEKRYSEFETLHRELSKLFLNIPQIPKKTLFKVSSVPELTKRRLELELFLKECVKRKDLLRSEQVSMFLDIEKQSPEILGNSPSIAGRVELPWGIRDFYYSREEGVIFMCWSEMNIVSRTDSRISNIKLPWEKTGDMNVPVGGVFVFRVQKLGIGYEFVKTWTKAFATQTGILRWNNISFTWWIGWDDGRIVCYHTDNKDTFEKFEELLEIKPHKDRVMGIEWDAENGYIYSCSSDKLFIVSDINLMEPPIEVGKNDYGYTNLKYDKPNNRCFLTDEGGNLDVYLTSVHPPELVTHVTIGKKVCIRGFHIDYKKYLIFACNTIGDINILDLGLPGKEKTIKEISVFGGKTKLRVIQYDSWCHEIISGDQNGRITVWSLKNGEAIYAWSAHDGKAITQLHYEESKRILWSGAKDKTVKIWQLPEKWNTEEIEKFEKNELKQINDNWTKEKIQKNLKRIEANDSDSSYDDLLGWDLWDE